MNVAELFWFGLGCFAAGMGTALVLNWLADRIARRALRP